MKAKYCPRCKSINVRVKVTASAVFGVPQKWECMNCSFESHSIFPEGEIEEEVG